MSRRLQRGLRGDVTHLTNSQSRHQEHKNAARQMANAAELGMVVTKLWVLSAEVGSCHSLGASNFKLAPTFMENLCTSGVDC